ncbi:hypothetical protein BDV98DRAFT_563162 [Pterulicium gracile]|uniref:Uncharacterized protein n=1 Tax=Pterulicium gracile TaxID=1884261 RepID=A0A5C3QTI7_9AGAR|nr:hypothetical protein BDV98DRAFT_563162 [Pterula gracilis]
MLILQQITEITFVSAPCHLAGLRPPNGALVQALNSVDYLTCHPQDVLNFYAFWRRKDDTVLYSPA